MADEKAPSEANSPPSFDLPKLEEKVLEFWRANRVFEKSLAQRKGKKPFVFYEGPPTANGKPGIHHVLARAFKDIVLRYKTMRGFFAPRRGGWDTHGLPVEIEVEKQLGLKSKKDIEKFGIAEFNKKCRESVWTHKEEWERLTERMGFWLDLAHPYITYETDYMETLWWIIKEAWKKKLLYKGHKVVPWCMRCGTALSSHELAQGYKETTDKSVYVKFKLKPGQKIGKNFTTDDGTYILSWTTTPWTLPGNVTLAVGKDIEYVLIRRFAGKWTVSGKAIYDRVIIAKEIFERYENEPASVAAQPFHFLWVKTPSGCEVTEGPDVVAELKGNEIVGLEYEPLFEIPALKNRKSHRVYAADFVTTTEGTGVVHTAVMYGEDDYELGKKIGLPQHHTVDEEGRFTKDVPGLAGLYVKSKETEKKLLDYLRTSNFELRTEPYTHEYPFCWRCDQPVIYYARTSWFIAMSALRGKLLAANKNINWVPSHMKEGRFGEWLRGAKDWNFSRERFWGTPLPIWECRTCGAEEVIGSVEELRGKSPPSRNRYWAMRHGEAESNLRHLIDSGQQKHLHLTLKGRVGIERSVVRFKKELEKHRQKTHLIAYSSITRTKETALLAAQVLGVPKKNVVADPRIREIQLGPLSGCHDKEYHAMFPTYASRFARGPKGGESLRDLRARVWEFFKHCEKKYRGKNILIVSHEYPIWMMHHAALGWSERRAIEEKERRDEKKSGGFAAFAEITPLELVSLPRNETGEADLHRPYVDGAVFPCAECGGTMRRVAEVADVWFDSGAMPFASQMSEVRDQMSDALRKKSDLRNLISEIQYPADYIVEAVDQTRGWFYTLLAVGVLLGKGAPYKNVVSLGHINDKFGHKMSKSKGNVVDPSRMAEKYGIDAVRWYFFTATPPGEPKNFDEAEILKTFRRFHLIAWNSLKFFKTYGKRNLKSQISNLKSGHVLDVWILARLEETIAGATAKLDTYDIREAALAIEEFVDDLSRWYIRRSRRRLQKPADKKEHAAASATLGVALRELAALLAPFTPFFVEIVHKELGGKRSVHLEDWPQPKSKVKSQKSKVIIEQMAEVRRLAALALAKRAEAGIKVRQPLQTLRVRSSKFEVRGRSNVERRTSNDLLAILAEEVNVKEVIADATLKGDVELNTAITPELREEGVMRELVRLVQDLRQEARLKPRDRIELFLEAPESIARAAHTRKKELQKAVGAARVAYRKSGTFTAETERGISGGTVKIAIRKI